jgi:hypothetical protein
MWKEAGLTYCDVLLTGKKKTMAALKSGQPVFVPRFQQLGNFLYEYEEELLTVVF